MKEEKLISLTALKNAFEHTLSIVADEDVLMPVKNKNSPDKS